MEAAKQHMLASAVAEPLGVDFVLADHTGDGRINTCERSGLARASVGKCRFVSPHPFLVGHKTDFPCGAAIVEAPELYCGAVRARVRHVQSHVPVRIAVGLGVSDRRLESIPDAYFGCESRAASRCKQQDSR